MSSCTVRFTAAFAAAAGLAALAAPAFAAPEITSVPVLTSGPAKGCLVKGKIWSAIGKGFAPQAGKGLAIGGQGIHVTLPPAAWFDTTIRFTLPNDPKIEEGQTYYIGVETADGGKWLSNFSVVTICAKGVTF